MDRVARDAHVEVALLRALRGGVGHVSGITKIFEALPVGILQVGVVFGEIERSAELVLGVEFARTQTVFSLGRIEAGWILNCLHFNPFRVRHLRRSGQASASDDNFVVNLRGDINTCKDSIEEVKTAELGQNNKPRRICYDGHALRRSAVWRSSSRSST